MPICINKSNIKHSLKWYLGQNKLKQDNSFILSCPKYYFNECDLMLLLFIQMSIYFIIFFLFILF